MLFEAKLLALFLARWALLATFNLFGVSGRSSTNLEQSRARDSGMQRMSILIEASLALSGLRLALEAHVLMLELLLVIMAHGW